MDYLKCNRLGLLWQKKLFGIISHPEISPVMPKYAKTFAMSCNRVINYVFDL